MKVMSAVLLATLVPAAGLAQSAPAPKNFAGSGVSPSVRPPTNIGESGNINGTTVDSTFARADGRSTAAHSQWSRRP